MKKPVAALLLLAGATAHAQKAALPYVFAEDIATALCAQPDQNQPAAWQYPACAAVAGRCRSLS